MGYKEKAEQAREEIKSGLPLFIANFKYEVALNQLAQALDTMDRIEALANTRVRADRLTMQSDYSPGYSDGKFEALEAVMKKLEGQE